MQHLLAHKNLYLSVAILWTLGIAVACLVSFNDLPGIKIIGGTDKYVHFILHFGFTGLWFLHFRKESGNRRKTLIKVVTCSFLYGIAIEFAQESFTTTRHADIFDVIANTSGAIAAMFVINAYNAYFKK
jgi:VanZ family protein